MTESLAGRVVAEIDGWWWLIVAMDGDVCSAIRGVASRMPLTDPGLLGIVAENWWATRMSSPFAKEQS